MANALAEYIVKSARKTEVAICFASKAEASRSFQEEFTTAVFENGGRMIKTGCDFSDANFDAAQVPAQVTSDGAEAIVLAPSLGSVRHAIDVLQAAQGRLPIFGSQTMYAMETLKQGQADAKNMVLAVPWHPGMATGSSFTTTSQKLWGGAGNWRTAMAYDATMVAISGLKLGQSREQVQQALTNSGFVVQGATGTIRFLPSGDRLMKASLVRVQPGQGSGTNYDFVPLSNPALLTPNSPPNAPKSASPKKQR